MKILIASDIHGSEIWMQKLVRIANQENPDKILLLGDLLYHGARNALTDGYNTTGVAKMLNSLAEAFTLICVRGNCDSEVDQAVIDFPCTNDYAIVECESKLIFATHGHIYSPTKLPPFINGSEYIFASGHTHAKHDSEIDGIRCINPGSVSLPRDGVNNNSCAVLEGETLRFINLSTA